MKRDYNEYLDFYKVFHEKRELKLYIDDICCCLIKDFSFSLYSALGLILKNIDYICESYNKKESVEDLIIDIYPLCG